MSSDLRWILVLPAVSWSFACHAQPDHELLRQRMAAMQHATPALRLATARPAGDAIPPSRAEVLAAADLDRYVRYGLHHNAGLRASYEQFLATVDRIPQVSSLADPVFTFSQFVEEVQTRTGPQRRRYSLTQAVPWFGELDLRGDVARGDVEQAWQRVVQMQLTVEREIAVGYAEYAYLAEAIRITGEVLELLRQLEPVVQRRIAAGTASQADLLRLQVEIGRIENDLASRRRVQPSMSARLAAAMNWQGQQDLPMPALQEPQLTPVGVEELLRQAYENNPELRELAERARQGSDRLRLAKLDGWPDFQVGVDYIETGDALSPVPGSGDDPWALRIGFSLPLWRARYAAAEREAERGIRAAMALHEDRRVRLRAEVEAAAFQLDDAARQVVLYRESLLPRAREALTVTRTAYSSGNASLLDTIDSERALLEFEIGYWRACRDHHQSRARLEALIGGAQR